MNYQADYVYATLIAVTSRNAEASTQQLRVAIILTYPASGA